MTYNLPTLPEPAGVIIVGTQALRAFTADQMQEYAIQTIESTRLFAMTPEQIADACNETQASRILAFLNGVRTAEAHHSIAAQAEKGGA